MSIAKTSPQPLMPSVIEALQSEVVRVRAKRARYVERRADIERLLGAASARGMEPAIRMMSAEIDQAEQAIREHDTVHIIRLLKVLKEYDDQD